MKWNKVEVFIPKESFEKLMGTLNKAELIREGNYDTCFSSVEVTGHWRPLPGAKPYRGAIGEISVERELKLEFRIEAGRKEECEKLIRAIHPYEKPVINFIELL